MKIIKHLKKKILKDDFESILKFSKRTKIIQAYNDTILKYKKKLNWNFFKAPQFYDTYDRFVSFNHEHLHFGPDLSKPAMSCLFYLHNIKKKKIKFLDHGCGLSALVKYASVYGQAYSFDNFNQVPQEAIEYFYKKINLDPAKTLLSIEGVLKYKPNIMSVCGNWVSDLSLYEQPSLKFLLSDTLYNSGRIKGQGVYYYNKFWKTPPEKFGFKLIAQLPLLDIFYRS